MILVIFVQKKAMFLTNRLLFVWIYFAISSYVTYDLFVRGLSNDTYEGIVQIVVGPLVLIIALLNLISKFRRKKR